MATWRNERCRSLLMAEPLHGARAPCVALQAYLFDRSSGMQPAAAWEPSAAELAEMCDLVERDFFGISAPARRMLSLRSRTDGEVEAALEATASAAATASAGNGGDLGVMLHLLPAQAVFERSRSCSSPEHSRRPSPRSTGSRATSLCTRLSAR